METKSIWRRLWDRIPGGWRTWGPGLSIDYEGYGSSGPLGSTYFPVSESAAMRLSAVWACMNTRSETIGRLPFYLTDVQRNHVTDHWLADLMNSPNADMTQMEFMSMATAQIDMHGNHISQFDRRRDGSIISLEPADPTCVEIEWTKTGLPVYNIGGDKVPRDRILHLRGFSMDGMIGLPRLMIGRLILSAQLEANASALLSFKQGLKVGGFFEVADNFTVEQKAEIKNNMIEFSKPENAGRWMTLLKGMKPVSGEKFSVSPQEAQLLESRYFGIEEICRLFNVPPQLIYQTDKASSWASSLENINMFFLAYSVMPTLTRNQQSIAKQLLTVADRRKVFPRFDTQELMRPDAKARQQFYASGLQNGWLCQDDVREMEDYPDLPNGEGKIFRVQVNMGKVGDDEDKNK